MAKETQTKKRHAIGFDDENVRGTVERPEKYSAKVGRTDRVRIMTDAVPYYGAEIKGTGANKGFFAISNADPDDCQKAMDGDPAATKRCEAKCVLWKDGYPIKRKFAVLLYHVESMQKGRVKAVNAPIPWSFSADRYTTLRNLQKSMPINEKTGKPRDLKYAEILIDCTDEQYQKLNLSIAPSTKTKRADVLAEIGDCFEVEGDPTSTCPLIEELIAPDPVTQLKASIARAQGAGEDSDEFDRDDERPRSGKKRPRGDDADAEADELDDVEDDEPPARKPGKSKPKAAEPDDEDEPEDEDNDAESEDDEPAPPKAKKSNGKVTVKSGKKPKPAESEDESDLDLEDELD